MKNRGLLYIGSFISSILPLTTVFAINWNKYTTTPSNTLKLCFGGSICIVFVVLKVIGKLKLPKMVVSLAIVFVLSYLLESILADLTLLSGMALLGELTDNLTFQKAIANSKEKNNIVKQEKVLVEQVREIIKYNGRV